MEKEPRGGLGHFVQDLVFVGDQLLAQLGVDGDIAVDGVLFLQPNELEQIADATGGGENLRLLD